MKTKLAILFLLFCNTVLASEEVICGGGYCGNFKIYANKNKNLYECESVEIIPNKLICYKKDSCLLWCEYESEVAHCGHCEVEQEAQ